MDKIKNIIFLLIGISFSTNIFSQEIFGKVVDDLGDPLPFVNIYFENLGNGTVTDFDGFYRFQLGSTDSITVRFSFIGLDEKIIRTIPGELNVTLSQSAELLEAVEVITKKSKESETILILDKKSTMTLESSIGSQEINKKGISNTKETIKKITGVSFNNNSLNIRGLDDRYNLTTLNGLYLSSNNLDRKNIDLNLLPTSLIGNIKVSKTYSSDIGGNFSGARINLNSIDVKESQQIKISTNYTNLYVKPTYSIGFVKGYVSERVSNLTELKYSEQNYFNSGSINQFNKQGDYYFDYEFIDTLKTGNLSFLNVTNFDRKNIKFSNTFFLIKKNDLNNRSVTGRHYDYEDNLYTLRNTPIYNNLFLDQMSLNLYGENIDTDIRLGYSYVNSGENGRSQFVFLEDGGYRFNHQDVRENHIFSNTNTEQTISYLLNFNLKEKLHFGYNGYYADNRFDYSLEYFNLQGLGYVNHNNPFSYINEDTETDFINDPSSNVNGYRTLNSVFGKYFFNKDQFNFTIGGRVESIIGEISYKNQVVPSITERVNLNSLEILPHLDIKYKLDDEKQIRFNNSLTYIMPKFRELTEFEYTEIFAGTKIRGNSDLVNSKCFNTDLSYENYFDGGQYFMVNLFNKYILNPTERINVATSSGRLETFQNSSSAIVSGVEIEIKKKYKKISLDYNLSILRSKIFINDNLGSSVIVTNSDRPLQGSTPILSNFDIIYELNEKHILGFTTNYIGRKLNSVGIQGLGDIYQEDQLLMNFIYNLKLSKITLILKGQNILNTSFRLNQQTDNGQKVVNEYLIPQGINFSLSFAF
jgi:hypothetical protein